MNAAKLLVYDAGKFACVRIVGRANFHSSVDFKTLVNELKARGCHFFVLDLEQCVLMDSTFLGVLAGFGLKSRASEGEESWSIELLNPNTRIMELLESLGVLELFQVAQGLTRVPEGCAVAEHVPASPASKLELSNACLEAHETLMSLSPENRARFKDVAQFLAEDIKHS